MPTDGTLFLENIPRGKRYLLTLLSVFFSFGAVLSAVIGLVVIPSNSCPPAPEPCNPEEQNLGWRYLLTTLSVLVRMNLLMLIRTLTRLFIPQTLSMFMGRFILFKLYESPRYLVHTGRAAAAVNTLKKITKYNGQSMELDIKDVQDHPNVPSAAFEMDDGDLPPTPGLKCVTTPPESKSNTSSPLGYQSTESQSQPALTGDYTFQTPIDEARFFPESPIQVNSPTLHSPQWRRSPERPRRPRQPSRTESVAPVVSGWFSEWVTQPLAAWFEQVGTILTPEWRRSTLLVWTAWSFMSLGEFAPTGPDVPTQILLFVQRTQSSTSSCQSCWKPMSETWKRRTGNGRCGTWSPSRWQDALAPSCVLLARSSGLCMDS